MRLGCYLHFLALIIQENQFYEVSFSCEIIFNYISTGILPKLAKSDYRPYSAWKYRLTKELGGIFCPSPCLLLPTTIISSRGNPVRRPGGCHELINLPSKRNKHCHVQGYQWFDDTGSCFITNNQCRAVNYSLSTMRRNRI